MRSSVLFSSGQAERAAVCRPGVASSEAVFSCVFNPCVAVSGLITVPVCPGVRMFTGALKLNMQECQETSQKVLMATVQTVSREAVLYVCCEKPHYVGWATERSFARCANTRGGYRFSGYHDARAHVGGSRPAGMTTPSRRLRSPEPPPLRPRWPRSWWPRTKAADGR